MKSYKNLYEKFLSDENIKLAIVRSSKGKRDRKEVAEIFNNQDKYLNAIRNYAADFKSEKHKPVSIYDGISRKKREIIVPKYREQIVHHMIINIMQEVFMKSMYEHSYGSIPGRGAHSGKKRVEKWIREDRKNCKYVLKMDIKKYFNTIDKTILEDLFRKKIKDEHFVKILVETINVTEEGIPLGFYTSQWYANWYLEELDHMIKEKLGATHYIRYMDDMVIFGSNKRKLHQMRRDIEAYLKEERNVKLKENWQVYRFSHKKGGRDLDFMGFRFYWNKTIMRKKIMFRASRKAKRVWKKEKPTIYDCKQMLAYLGMIRCTDTYGMYEEHIKPYVDLGKMKKRVSEYTKRREGNGLEKVKQHRKTEGRGL